MTTIPITHVLQDGTVLTYDSAHAERARHSDNQSQYRTDRAPASPGPRDKFLRDTRDLWRCNSADHDARQDELEHVEPRDNFIKQVRDMWVSA